MHQACRIRSYRRRDLAAMRKVAGRAFAPVFSALRARLGEPLASQAYGTAEEDQIARLEQLCASAPARDVLVVECGQRVIGFGQIILDHDRKIGEIGLNAIDPAYQGRGYGRQLHEAMLTRMRAAGMCVATVAAGEDRAGSSARSALARAGFSRHLPSLRLYCPL